jgi:hypothetical protein
MTWDWTRRVVDHLDLHASDFRESACFTHVNVLAQTPPTP